MTSGRWVTFARSLVIGLALLLAVTGHLATAVAGVIAVAALVGHALVLRSRAAFTGDLIVGVTAAVVLTASSESGGAGGVVFASVLFAEGVYLNRHYRPAVIAVR